MTNINQLIISEDEGTYNIKNNLTKEQIIQIATHLIDGSFTTGNVITNPEDTRNYLKLKMGSLEHEVFSVLFLNTKHHVIQYEEMFRGTIDGTSVYPREVVKRALQLNAAAIIISHNHPSGVAEPSTSDEQITQRLKEACSLMDIRLLDHIIIGKGEALSLAERGLI